MWRHQRRVTAAMTHRCDAPHRVVAEEEEQQPISQTSDRKSTTPQRYAALLQLLEQSCTTTPSLHRLPQSTQRTPHQFLSSSVSSGGASDEQESFSCSDELRCPTTESGSVPERPPVMELRVCRRRPKHRTDRHQPPEEREVRDSFKRGDAATRRGQSCNWAADDYYHYYLDLYRSTTRIADDCWRAWPPQKEPGYTTPDGQQEASLVEATPDCSAIPRVMTSSPATQ